MNQNLLAKIEALLAVANHPNTGANEAEAASNRANVLMTKYAIDEAMLGNTNGDPKEMEVRKFNVGAPYAAQRRTLLGLIAKSQKLRSVGVGNGVVAVAGTKVQLDMLDKMFGALSIQMANAAANAREAGVSGAALVSWRTNFQKAWCSTVFKRLVEQRKNAETDATVEHGPGVGLMLRDESARMNEHFMAWFKQEYPGHTIRTSKQRAGSAGYGAGQSAGGRADIGNRRLAGRLAIGA